MPEKVGEEQLVPETGMGKPLVTTPKFSACADTSGKPLPVWLNRLLSGMPEAVDLYVLTKGCWKAGRSQ